MNYKIIILFLLVYLSSCTTINNKSEIRYSDLQSFSNSGFALIYNEDLYSNKLIKKKLDSRSLNIFHNKLAKNTKVKIMNPVNKKSVLAIVINNAKYPHFYNSVITNRIAESIELNLNEPYVQITSINQKNIFIAKKTKTFKEEQKVAETAPVDEITINNLSKENKKTLKKKNTKENFNYIIKIVDFYYMDTAKEMVKKIKKDTNISKVKILKISNKTHRVYLGPFDDLNSLKKSFDDISILNFDNIEIIKNN